MPHHPIDSPNKAELGKRLRAILEESATWKPIAADTRTSPMDRLLHEIVSRSYGGDATSIRLWLDLADGPDRTVAPRQLSTVRALAE